MHEDGSVRVHVVRSKSDQENRGTVLFLGPAAVEVLLASRQQERWAWPRISRSRGRNCPS